MGAVIETDVVFAAKRGSCAGSLFRPDGPSALLPLRPIVVLGHGLGAVRQMRLPAYARRFARAGYLAMTFDYRHFGESTGEPRQLVSIRRQQQDWRSAVRYARTIPGADPHRVAVFGTSFGGGHVIELAAKDPSIAAVIAQCPFTSGLASLARGGYLGLVPEGLGFTNAVAARIPLWSPGRLAANVTAPILFAVCRKDSVAPAGPTLRFAGKAPRGEIKCYPFGHFEIYTSAAFREAVEDYVDFLQEHVPAPEL